MTKWVYLFSEGDASMRNLLGGKGANLSEMTNMGLPIPQGFIVSTEACIDFYDQGKKVSDEVTKQIFDSIKELEKITDKKFGDLEEPLLVSIRSGARASMPGMMDTVLNLGLTDISVEGFAKKTGNPRFAYDSYRRFIQMYADVVKQIGADKFDVIFDGIKEKKGIKLDTDLDADDLKEIIVQFKALYKEESGEDFPQEPATQLMASIEAVFTSWDNPRAIYYRRMNNIPGNWGTAVNVQAMVFGNMGDTSGTGVAFTRDPSTGENKLYGEYLMNAQGEDVVAGVRTPHPMYDMKKDDPAIYDEFMEYATTLEKHYKDMQDLEFTIEDGKLYILQTRSGKRTGPAAIKIACDLVDEGMITKEEAIARMDAGSLDQLLHPGFDPKALEEGKIIGSALPASPGAASGRVYFTAADAKAAFDRGERVILTRLETSPEDIEGMHASEGILTARGGMTSHAAVVARGMGTSCVSGCEEMELSYEDKVFKLGGETVKEGDFISLDGSTGNIYLGDIATIPASISGDFYRLMEWADEIRTMEVRANADSPEDAKKAIELGAEGIGLTRTEHMFFEEDRIPKIRRMILSKSVEDREEALNELIPYQKADFKGIFEVMAERPVTIRFLDPPLHEFLPTNENEITSLAEDMNITVAEVKNTISALEEINPMLGHRGCRLTVSYPEIAKMQTTAVIEAAIEVKNEKGFNIVPEIMIPLVGEKKELKYVKDVVVKTADAIIAEKGSDLEYKVGTMIEIPRAALLADEIAEEADFFSFGTNDLTQMALGISRDDATKFLDSYYETEIYESDPFARLDQRGVGQLVQIAADKGRTAKPGLQLGICGEHGGDPSSIEFCYKVGLDYVSCSPFRVPIARLAAAQAVLNNK